MKEHNGRGGYGSSAQTKEKEIDDGYCEHGCRRAVRKSSSPVKSWGIRPYYEIIHSKAKTNMKITTDAEKSTTKAPFIEIVDESYTASEEDSDAP